MKINSPYNGGPVSSAKLKLHIPQLLPPHPLGDFLFPEYAKLVPFSVTPKCLHACKLSLPQLSHVYRLLFHQELA